jgi:hypothetical protein
VLGWVMGRLALNTQEGGCRQGGFSRGSARPWGGRVPAPAYPAKGAELEGSIQKSTRVRPPWEPRGGAHGW